MFEPFLTKFNITSKLSANQDDEVFSGVPGELFELVKLTGGCSFENGLYRIHTFSSSVKWSIQLAEYFPSYKNQILPFGFDWLGRQFCIDKSNKAIYMFDPSTVEDFKLEKSLSAFHSEDVVNDMFSADFFNSVSSFCNIKTLEYDDCLGYKIPLFLKGKDELSNFKVQNMDVYWHIVAQIWGQVKNLPEGTKIGNIKLE